MIRFRFLTSFLVCFILQIKATWSWTCYTPAGQDIATTIYDSDDASDYAPCNTNDNVPTTCCNSKNQHCSNDLLCRDDVGGIYRQFCTLDTWNTPYCSQLCPDYRDAGTELTSCPDGSFCCGFNNTACCNAGEGVQISSKGQILLANGLTSALPATVLQFSTNEHSQASSTKLSISASNTLSQTSQTSSKKTPSIASTSPTASPQHITNDPTPIGAIIGGVLGGVAVLLLAIIAFLLYRRSANKRKKVISHPHFQNMTEQYGRHQWSQGPNSFLSTTKQPGRSIYEADAAPRYNELDSISPRLRQKGPSYHELA